MAFSTEKYANGFSKVSLDAFDFSYRVAYSIVSVFYDILGTPPYILLISAATLDAGNGHWTMKSGSSQGRLYPSIWHRSGRRLQYGDTETTFDREAYCQRRVGLDPVSASLRDTLMRCTSDPSYGGGSVGSPPTSGIICRKLVLSTEMTSAISPTLLYEDSCTSHHAKSNTSCRLPLAVQAFKQGQIWASSSLYSRYQLRTLQQIMFLPATDGLTDLDSLHGIITGPRASGQATIALQSEKMIVHASIHDLEAQIGMTSRSRPNGNSVEILHALTETLQEDIAALRHHVEAYKDADPRCVEEKREGTEAMRLQAERWTNNIEILEGWLCEVIGTEQMDRLREECYGANYVEGEGLGDL
ncbi:MAG: hypothetical protein LQ341_002607 [Variospora aurantia]|nr:MAG: hypothetical protein LQ341_002607 [Variospora aurantia]